MPISRSQAFSALRCWSFAVLALATFGSEAATTSIVSGLATRAGVTVPLLVIDSTGDTPAPGATLILFTGGNGQLHLLDSNGGWQGASDLSQVRLGPTQNFLVRQRNNFAAQGFNIIMMDVPSDHSTGYPLTATSSFRKSANHQTDIAYVIDYARTTFGLPVWLVGTSRGSTSAAKGALMAVQQPTRDGPDGFVLTSTVTDSSDADNVLDMPLKNISLIAMMVANEDDACPITPPIGVNRIARRLLSSPDFRGKFVTNDPGSPPSDTTAAEECQGDGYHGFSNAEGKVVTPVSAWITGHLP